MASFRFSSGLEKGKKVPWGKLYCWERVFSVLKTYNHQCCFMDGHVWLAAEVYLCDCL